MKWNKNSLFTMPYTVRLRLGLFLVISIVLIAAISFTGIIGLNNTYNSLSDLRDRSLNQMFSFMELGVKTAQISTYTTRLTQTIDALEYKDEASQLEQHATQLGQLLEQLKHIIPLQNNQIISSINALEQSIQELLEQAHQRHLYHSEVLSHLHQSLLFITHIKRLSKSEELSPAFFSLLQEMETILENSAKAPPSPIISHSLQFMLELMEKEHKSEAIQQELEKIKLEQENIITLVKNVENINLRIKFLSYKINALVKNIDHEYSHLSRIRIQDVSSSSADIQHSLYKKILSILFFAVFIIILLIILSRYIYSLIGQRLFSITDALKRLAQGEKSISLPAQHSQDEISELANAFNVFHQNQLALERTDLLLKEKSELLEKTFLTIKDGFAIFDKQQKLISYNEKFKNLLSPYFEHAPDGPDLDSILDFFTQGEGKIYASGNSIQSAFLNQIWREKESIEIEYKERILEWRMSSLQDGLVVFLIERTQQRKLEMDLAHSQKMQAIGHLTGGIAHDFNNLLAVIIGNLDLIDLQQLEERQAKRLKRAMKAAENSATLTQRLLAYARKQPLHPNQLDINQLIIEFNDFLKHSIPPTIEVKLELSANLPLVFIDPSQLETALVNLIINAKDALNNHGVIIIRSQKLMVQRTHHQEEMVQLSIIDNGVGMEKETLERIFEPFFTTKKNKGSGLGLSMVYGFIRQSKGRVLAHSELGKGTEIHLQLPIAQQPQPEIQKPAPSYINNALQKVLLVEDQDSLRQTLNEQLLAMGYLPTSCANAEQALALLNQQKVDFLLSDIVLTGKINGIELAHKIKQQYPNIKVLLMTGHSESLNLATDFPVLNKPFRQEELQKALNQLAK